ncbi:MAG: outer membrane protein [Alphaproteobacteria bacterium]|jgi:outer membrane protein
MKKTILSTVIVSVLALTGVNAFAHEAGDILVRAGLTTVAPDDSSSNILVGGANFEIAGGVVGGVSVGANTQLGLNLAYFITDNWNVEVLAATPFSHKINLASGGGNLGKTKHLPPTVTANYFFADADAKFQPYAGIGLNYTVFFDEEFNDASVSSIDGAIGATISDLSLDSSFGLAAQLGADYEISDGIYVNASVRYISIETEAKFKVNGADLGSIETVEINPFVYTISIGYKF